MQSKAKKYGEYVEITAPVERTTSEEYPTLLGGEIWYNQNSSKRVLSESQTPGNLPEKLESNNRKETRILVQSIIWYSYFGKHVHQESFKSEIKEAPRSNPCSFVISQLDKFLRFRLPRLLTKQYRLNPRLKNRRLSLYRIYIRGISACRSSHPLRDDARA